MISINSKDASSSVLEPKINQHVGLKFRSPQPYLRWLTTFLCIFKVSNRDGFNANVEQNEIYTLERQCRAEKNEILLLHSVFLFFPGKKIT